MRTCLNYLDRQFAVDALCLVWLSDITYIQTTHGFRYLTSVIDLYERKVIGWPTSSTSTAADTSGRAYKMAVRSRRPSPGIIFHSNQGVRYTCEELRNALDKNVVQNMSRRGNCWDNAEAESFFKSLGRKFEKQPYALKKQKAHVCGYACLLTVLLPFCDPAGIRSGTL